MDEVQIAPFCLGTTALFSRRSPGKDTVNEDSCALIKRAGDDSGVIVLADGAGGHSGGDLASARAVESLVQFCAASEHENTRVPILDAIEHANEALLQQGQGAATTLLAVEIEANKVRPYYIGDSTILITGQRGLIKFQSIAQSPVGYAIESGIADEVEMRASEDRHLVSNLLGTSELHMTVGPWIKLAQRDTLLLCSDGLTDNLFMDDIINSIRKGKLASAANDLRSKVQANMEKPEGHPDDLSFVLFRLNP